MNKIILMGRLTRDPEVRFTQSNEPLAIANYTLAVDRRFKRDGDPEVDFLRCVAFGKDGEFAEAYLKKGMKISVVGELQTGDYTDKEGIKRYTTTVIVREHYFAESKSAYEAREQANDDFQKAKAKPKSRYTKK